MDPKICLDAVGIATGYGLDGPCSTPGSKKLSFSSTASRPTLGSHPAPIKRIPGDISPGVKQ
jgi:hypothetical protein